MDGTLAVCTYWKESCIYDKGFGNVYDKTPRNQSKLCLKEPKVKSYEKGNGIILYYMAWLRSVFT